MMICAQSFGGKNRVDIGLFLLRVALALVFIYHGSMKFFAAGTFDPTAIMGFFASLGVPAILGPIVGGLEVATGLMMLLGFMTNIAGWIQAIILVGAIYLVHWKNGFGAAGGCEFPLVLLLLAVAVAHLGAGRFAVCKDYGNPTCPTVPDEK